MRQDQEQVRSDGDKPRRSAFRIHMRSWKNAIGDLVVYVGRQLKGWLQKITGGVDPRKQIIRAVVIGAIVVATIGGVLKYFEYQLLHLGTEMQQFSSTQQEQARDTSATRELTVTGSTAPFHTGKVKLGLSEEELIEYMALEEAEALATLARGNRQRQQPEEELSEEALGALNLSKLVWPVQGAVKTGYGWWRHPLYRDWRLHTGIAITTPVGSSVRAALPGRVVDIYHDNYLRTVVVLEHSGQVRTVYGNLQDVAVTLGTSVAQGRVLGRAAASVEDVNSGEAYFEVRHRGQAIDPLLYLR